LITNPSVVQILLVDDFEPFRNHIRLLLLEQPDLIVICEVSDGPLAVQRAEELQPDLVLLDIGLPTLSGIEAARQIRNVAPKSNIIFVTQESSPEIVSEAFISGARGYIAKLDAQRDLLTGIDAVGRGEKFVSSSLTGPAFPRFTDQ